MFGLLDFAAVWLVQPIIAVYCMLLRCAAMPLRATLRAACDPLFQSASHALRHVSLTLQHQRVATGNHQHQQQSAGVEWLGYV